jgi:cysteinyl-tRNA synthetase
MDIPAFKIYNTGSRTIELFTPLKEGVVSMYACGPTVYDFTHIGHMRKYIGDDILKRTLLFLGYGVNHVMNITDVGHLSDDGDTGEDKLEKGAKKEGKTVWDIASFYTSYFHKTMEAVHVLPPTHETKATDHISEMIALTETLIAKGFAYETAQAVYFSVAKDVEYGKRVGKFADHAMYWPSPWGDGFPGWHIECSAMSMKYLGETIDIHTGGIDHIPVHHENEIAQSECATGKQFVRYWVHHDFLTVDGEKMSKSKQNFYTLDDIIKKGLDPLAVRLLCMQTSYRKPLNFTWEALAAADVQLKKLQKFARNQAEAGAQIESYVQAFTDALSDDLNMAVALSVVWEVLSDTTHPQKDVWATLLAFDEVLGLNLKDTPKLTITDEAQKLLEERDTARANKDYAKSDELRTELETLGYTVLDTKDGTVLE